MRPRSIHNCNVDWFRKLRGGSALCYRKALIPLMDENPKRAMEHLLSEAPSWYLFGYCHIHMHWLGRRYSNRVDLEHIGTVGDSACGSGFVHGVIETRVKRDPAGFTREMIDNLCEGTSPTWIQQHSCEHAIGHKIMYGLRQNQPAALEQCRRLAEGGDRFLRNCTSGVFMENITAPFREDAAKLSKRFDKKHPTRMCDGMPKWSLRMCYVDVQENLPVRNVVRLCEQIEKRGIDASSCYRSTMRVLMNEDDDDKYNWSRLCSHRPECAYQHAVSFGLPPIDVEALVRHCERGKVPFDEKLRPYCAEGAGYIAATKAPREHAADIVTTMCPMFTQANMQRACRRGASMPDDAIDWM